MEKIQLSFANETVKNQWYSGKPANQQAETVIARSVKSDVQSTMYGKVNSQRMEDRNYIKQALNW